jgi:hypothetical protein
VIQIAAKSKVLYFSEKKLLRLKILRVHKSLPTVSTLAK